MQRSQRIIQKVNSIAEFVMTAIVALVFAGITLYALYPVFVRAPASLLK